MKGLKLICGNSNSYYITSHSNNEEITIDDNNNCNNILIKNKLLVTNDQVEKVTIYLLILKVTSIYLLP